MNQGAPVTITKRFTLEMAHALRGYDGPCAHIHGHSYILDVSLQGIPLNEPSATKDGMVMDFGDLRTIVKACVLDHYDHALVLHEHESEGIPTGHALFSRTRFTRWQPTCENLLLDMVQRIGRHLPNTVKLHQVRLQETATSWAEWKAPMDALPIP